MTQTTRTAKLGDIREDGIIYIDFKSEPLVSSAISGSLDAILLGANTNVGFFIKPKKIVYVSSKKVKAERPDFHREGREFRYCGTEDMCFCFYSEDNGKNIPVKIFEIDELVVCLEEIYEDGNILIVKPDLCQPEDWDSVRVLPTEGRVFKTGNCNPLWYYDPFLLFDKKTNQVEKTMLVGREVEHYLSGKIPSDEFETHRCDGVRSLFTYQLGEWYFEKFGIKKPELEDGLVAFYEQGKGEFDQLEVFNGETPINLVKRLWDRARGDYYELSEGDSLSFKFRILVKKDAELFLFAADSYWHVLGCAKEFWEKGLHNPRSFSISQMGNYYKKKKERGSIEFCELFGANSLKLIKLGDELTREQALLTEFVYCKPSENIHYKGFAFPIVDIIIREVKLGSPAELPLEGNFFKLVIE